MKILKSLIAPLCLLFAANSLSAADVFPDGTPISEWFLTNNEPVNVKTLGKLYRITDYNVKLDSTVIQTAEIQAVIDRAGSEGGGVIVIPKGVFLTGGLFFKPKTHLYLEEGGMIKGSDDISNFPILMTRIEGQTLKYFSALINADGLDGFTISGKGTINGNGLRYWRSFWLRRQVNPACTNMDEMRPRLVYLSNCKNVKITGVRLENSPFWTTHIYHCENVKLIGLHIFAPEKPVKAPSSDAVDVDACKNVLIKNCFLSVNDDAVALKGGKGPTADKDPNNGENRNLIIEDCTYDFCHSALTCGSESIHNYNILFRRCKINRAQRLLWLKMRPDTPQNYEYITLEDIEGNATNFIYIHPWTQFFDLKGHDGPLMSYGSKIVMRNIKFDCSTLFNVRTSEQYKLSDFTFENLEITAKNAALKTELVNNFTVKNVAVNGEKYK